VDIFVNSVFLYDDKIGLTFNWKEGTKTVILGELEAVSENTEGGETFNSSGFLNFYINDNSLYGFQQIFLIRSHLLANGIKSYKEK